jgi:HTH-type transcriptional regulator/antitoxin HigA
MTAPNLEKTIALWEALDREAHALLKPIETTEEHAVVLDAFERLMDLVAERPGAPLAGLYELLGEHLREYERRAHPAPNAAPHEILAFLMDRHNLHQADLPEVGSQGVVSEILAGKRRINVRQARALADRFGVPADAFI